ncbi:MAG: toxin-antitoxin system YwqK family antitoxin [Flavobacteriales bacterium]|jgi:antitoxin component YwqK of YwqJK toxin-antitoxin module
MKFLLKVLVTSMCGLLICDYCLAQTVLTKEVKIPYTNGYEIFKICTSGCLTKFEDHNEYFWYNEYSGLKSTRGGNGGNLLHGNYKFFDESGNLRKECNYWFGLKDGVEKEWDSLGYVVSQIKYVKGNGVYIKFQNEDDYWIEINGPLLEKGTTRKVYTPFNVLVREETILTGFFQKVKTYYIGGGIMEEYTESLMESGDLRGKYTSYYENGRIEVEGQFYDGEFLNIRVGIWKWYNTDGILISTSSYKADISLWPNGKPKSTGGYLFNNESNDWVKVGEWRFYDENGKLQSEKYYEEN